MIWFLFSGLVLAATAIDKSKHHEFWREAVVEQLKVLVLIERLVQAYTFSLPVEILLVP